VPPFETLGLTGQRGCDQARGLGQGIHPVGLPERGKLDRGRADDVRAGAAVHRQRPVIAVDAAAFVHDDDGIVGKLEQRAEPLLTLLESCLGLLALADIPDGGEEHGFAIQDHR